MTKTIRFRNWNVYYKIKLRTCWIKKTINKTSSPYWLFKNRCDTRSIGPYIKSDKHVSIFFFVFNYHTIKTLVLSINKPELPATSLTRVLLFGNFVVRYGRIYNYISTMFNIFDEEFRLISIFFIFYFDWHFLGKGLYERI